MDTFQLPPPEKQPPLLHGDDFNSLFSASGQPHMSQGMFTTNMRSNTPQNPPQTDYNMCQWTSSPGYDGHPYGYRPHFPPASPGLESYGGPPLVHGYSVPPPPLPWSSPRQFPPTVNTVHPSTKVGPTNTYNKIGSADVPKMNQHSKANSGFIQQREYQDLSERYGEHLLSYPPFPPQGNNDSDQSFGKTVDTRPGEEKAAQRRQDEQWVRRFLQSRGRASKSPESQRPDGTHVPQIREALYGAVRLVSKLSLACETLKHNLEDESVWMDSYGMALEVKRELQEKLKVLDDRERLDDLKMKLSCVAKRRGRRWRRKLVQMEDKCMDGQISEKEASIDKWRMKKIQEVEEKKMEQELKMAADAVLCEVRKKQADVKRMQDVLRSLEKLRKLRKEAASRKGIFPDQESDREFTSRLEQLRAVMRRRTAVYSAEEKALRVMLEGEQEEERRRDAEKRQRKERERQLQRKREMDAVLFGEEMPADCPLQPFRQYYTQAEHSLAALLQIRREWDGFLVAVLHPDGAAVPQAWVLPDPPSDQAWASFLHNAGSL